MPAFLLGNFVWEGKSTELPTSEEGACDGHIMKCLDTGESYIRRYGEWILINLGLSQIAATKSGLVITGHNGVANIVFATPFINSEYTLSLSTEDRGSTKPAMAFFRDVATTGFTIQTRDSKKGDPLSGVTVSWLATRKYDP